MKAQVRPYLKAAQDQSRIVISSDFMRPKLPFLYTN